MILDVYYSSDPINPVHVGQLSWYQHRAHFSYHENFLKEGLNLSPFMLHFNSDVQEAETMPWSGLHGLFNDSLPDGWGMLLMDKYFMQHKQGVVTPLDRLAYLGKGTMGALTYQPASNQQSETVLSLDLFKISEHAKDVYHDNYKNILSELMHAGGSPNGARPKIVAHVHGDEMIVGDVDAPKGFEPWLIKFHAREDEQHAGIEEYAYSLMAHAASIHMPETRLFSVKGQHYFGIKRFDRMGAKRIHMHSMAGMHNADFRMPSLDYTSILKTAKVLTKQTDDVHAAFKLMVFNVLIGNKDDHAKNFSFLMGEDGLWRFSPAYDLTKSEGINHCHTTAVNGVFHAIAKDDLFAVGESVDISQIDMNQMYDSIKDAVEQKERWMNQALAYAKS